MPESDVVYVLVNGPGFLVAPMSASRSVREISLAAAGTERPFDGFTPDSAVWVIAAG